MTETPCKTRVTWVEFIDDVLEAVVIVSTGAIEEPCRAT
jgi:hypothetical protein